MPWYLHRQKHPESVWPHKASPQDGIKDAPDDCAEAGKVPGGGHPAQVEVESGEREEVELDPTNDGDDRHQRLQDDPDRAAEGHLVDLAVEALQSKLDPHVAQWSRTWGVGYFGVNFLFAFFLLVWTLFIYMGWKKMFIVHKITDYVVKIGCFRGL